MLCERRGHTLQEASKPGTRNQLLNSGLEETLERPALRDLLDLTHTRSRGGELRAHAAKARPLSKLRTCGEEPAADRCLRWDTQRSGQLLLCILGCHNVHRVLQMPVTRSSASNLNLSHWKWAMQNNSHAFSWRCKALLLGDIRKEMDL